MKFSNKSQYNIKKTQLKFMGCRFFLVLFFLFSFQIVAQDSIAFPESLNEKKELEFQQFFFKALSEKAFHNYQKAIENFESCHQILPNDVAVFFEFSKNYFLLNQYQLAKEYVQRALENDAENKWMLAHLIAILNKEKNYAAAIKIQEQIYKKNPKDFDVKASLAKLYVRNQEPKKALELLNKLEQEIGLPVDLRRLKADIEKKPITKPSITNVEHTSSIATFEADKSYNSLEQILKNTKDQQILLKYSAEGIRLFPAQPYVYLIQARTLNNNKEYQKALQILKDGVDFVIDDNMEQEFYKEFAKTYKGLGNNLEQKKYLKKIQK